MQPAAELPSITTASSPPTVPQPQPRFHHHPRIPSSLMLILPLLLSIATAAGLSHDGFCLLALKREMVAPPPDAASAAAFDNWNDNDSTPCHWHGVTCNTLSGFTEPRVVSLSIVGLNLSGILPPELAGLDELRRLSLHHNRISGSVPAAIFTNATQLRSVFLQSNNISGAVPPEISAAQFLQNLDLSSNSISGEIPAEIGQCRQLQRLSLAGNAIRGSIPAAIGANLTSLESLDLSDNLLTGPIPPELGNLTSLQSTLNLSFNFLAGSIPDSLARLPYTVGIDLSHNNLSGRIPQEGSLVDQGPGAFMGNPGLCGFPLSRPCPAAPPAPTIPSIPHDTASGSVGEMQPVGPYGAATPGGGEGGEGGRGKGKGMGAAAIVGIAVGDAVGISAVGGLLLYFYWKAGGKERGEEEEEEEDVAAEGKRWRCCGGGGGGRREGGGGGGAGEESTEEGSSGNEGGGGGGRLVALDKGFKYEGEELLRAAAVVLGKGGSGIVYRVKMGGGAEEFAVRRVGGDGGSGGGAGGKAASAAAGKRGEWEAEAEGVARVAARHPNVVRLRAVYWTPDEKLLIYDFLPNGSLAAALCLHHPPPPPSGHSQAPPLTWPQRLKVVAGTASGLAFLHDCKYVHGDVKASNILLDSQLNGVIADFGASRLANIAAPPSPATWQGAGSSSAAYRPPERSSGGALSRPTQKWDVYAFGVVLLEVISGRSAAAHLVNGGEDLLTLGRRAAAAATARAELLEKTLMVEHEGQMMDVLHVAIACTSTSAETRPRMKAVAETLQKLGGVPSAHL